MLEYHIKPLTTTYVHVPKSGFVSQCNCPVTY